MKKIYALIIILTINIVFLTPVHAIKNGSFPATSNQFHWELNDYGVLTITGSGKINYFPYTYNIPWYNYRNDINSVVLSEGITSVGRNAFYRCTTLKTVTLPSTLESIHTAAFDVCPSLTTVSYNGSRTEYDNVTLIGSVPYLKKATVFTSESNYPIYLNDKYYISIYDALSNASFGDEILIQNSYDGEGDSVVLADNVVISIINKNLKNLYIMAESENVHINIEDVQVIGKKLFFNEIGDLSIEVGYNAKLISNITDNTKRYGFIWTVLSDNITPDSNIVFKFSGFSNGINYENQQYTHFYGDNKNNDDDKTQFGFVFNNIPDEINVDISEVN